MLVYMRVFLCPIILIKIFTSSKNTKQVTSQMWPLFLSLTETKWTVPEHTTDLHNCWIRRGGNNSLRRNGGESSHPIYGRQNGKKDTIDVLKIVTNGIVI